MAVSSQMSSTNDLRAAFGPPVEVIDPGGAAGLVLVCEHASADIPPVLGDLGLAPDARHSHAAWDIGAAALARRLSQMLSAPLVEARLSRLVYDCNRPPKAPDAIPSRVEAHDVPGNRGLDAAHRAARAAAIHDPFHAALARTLADRPDAALVTIHSFTPVWNGTPREVEIGFLHGADDRLAQAMLAAVPAGWVAALNAPYGPSDGVLHTIDRHGTAAGRASVMIEIRNDLLATQAQQEAAAGLVARCLDAAGVRA